MRFRNLITRALSAVLTAGESAERSSRPRRPESTKTASENPVLCSSGAPWYGRQVESHPRPAVMSRTLIPDLDTIPP
jgi:hypothetical protein